MEVSSYKYPTLIRHKTKPMTRFLKELSIIQHQHTLSSTSKNSIEVFKFPFLHTEHHFTHVHWFYTLRTKIKKFLQKVLPLPLLPTNLRSLNFATWFFITAVEFLSSAQQFSSLPARTVTKVPSPTSPRATTLNAIGSVLFDRQWVGNTVQTTCGEPVGTKSSTDFQRILIGLTVNPETKQRFVVYNVQVMVYGKIYALHAVWGVYQANYWSIVFWYVQYFLVISSLMWYIHRVQWTILMLLRPFKDFSLRYRVLFVLLSDM